MSDPVIETTTDDKLKMSDAQKIALQTLLANQGVANTGESFTAVGSEWYYDTTPACKRELVIARAYLIAAGV